MRIQTTTEEWRNIFTPRAKKERDSRKVSKDSVIKKPLVPIEPKRLKKCTNKVEKQTERKWKLTGSGLIARLVRGYHVTGGINQATRKTKDIQMEHIFTDQV